MAQNQAGPFLLKFPYVINGFSHTHTINVYADDPSGIEIGDADINLISKGGTAIPVDIAANAYWNVSRLFMPIGVLAKTWELWRAGVGDVTPTWFSGGPLTNPDGASQFQFLAARQLIITYRANRGGLMKFVWMEGAYGDERRPLDTVTAGNEKTFHDYVTGNTSVAFARANGYPASPVSYAGSQNEATAKKRFRG